MYEEGNQFAPCTKQMIKEAISATVKSHQINQ